MTARLNQLGFVSAPLNIQGTQFQGSYMPNPGWQVSSREQLLQDQLQGQEFQAWKLRMSKNLAQGSQAQAPPSIGLSGPSNVIDAPGNVVINKSERSASVK